MSAPGFIASAPVNICFQSSFHLCLKPLIKGVLFKHPALVNANVARVLCAVTLRTTWCSCAGKTSVRGPHRLPVAPAGAGHDRDGELQPGRSKGARLLVRRRDPKEEGNTHPAGGLRQDPARVGQCFSL